MENNQTKISALTIPELVKALKRSGGRTVSEEAIRRDIENGAPVNTDGTINLLHYAAWLTKEAADYGDERI